MTKANSLSLKNHFLIAMPELGDESIFSGSLTYLCDHSEDGAMGIIINQPTSLSLADIFEDLEIEHRAIEADQQQVLTGGPVATNRGFVLHPRNTPGKTDTSRVIGDDMTIKQQSWKSSVAVSDTVQLTTSTDILSAIAHGLGPKHSLVALGYAGWGPGQLEQELLNNAWLSVPANDEILFHTPTALKAEAASKLLGIDLSLIVPAGHA